MRVALDLIRTAALMLFAVTLSAALHGLFSLQPRGVWFMPIVLLVMGFCVVGLPEEIKFYGCLACGSVFFGVILWSFG